MRIYIGADHNGYDMKRQIVSILKHEGHEVIDEGDALLHPDNDFPVYAGTVATALLADPDRSARGILICGSGQGMCMAANRFKGIRASLCWSVDEARSARNDDDSNVLCLSATYTSFDDTIAILRIWLSTPFAGAPRFERRLKQLDTLG